MAEKNWWESAPLAETPQSNNSNDDWYKSAPLANQDQTQPQGLSPLGNNDWSGYEGGPQITQADLDAVKPQPIDKTPKSKIDQLEEQAMSQNDTETLNRLNDIKLRQNPETSVEKPQSVEDQMMQTVKKYKGNQSDQSEIDKLYKDKIESKKEADKALQRQYDFYASGPNADKAKVPDNFVPSTDMYDDKSDPWQFYRYLDKSATGRTIQGEPTINNTIVPKPGQYDWFSYASLKGPFPFAKQNSLMSDAAREGTKNIILTGASMIDQTFGTKWAETLDQNIANPPVAAKVHEALIKDAFKLTAASIAGAKMGSTAGEAIPVWTDRVSKALAGLGSIIGGVAAQNPDDPTMIIGKNATFRIFEGVPVNPDGTFSQQYLAKKMNQMMDAFATVYPTSKGLEVAGKGLTFVKNSLLAPLAAVSPFKGGEIARQKRAAYDVLQNLGIGDEEGIQRLKNWMKANKQDVQDLSNITPDLTATLERSPMAAIAEGAHNEGQDVIATSALNIDRQNMSKTPGLQNLKSQPRQELERVGQEMIESKGGLESVDKARSVLANEAVSKVNEANRLVPEAVQNSQVIKSKVDQESRQALSAVKQQTDANLSRAQKKVSDDILKVTQDSENKVKGAEAEVESLGTELKKIYDTDKTFGQTIDQLSKDSGIDIANKFRINETKKILPEIVNGVKTIEDKKNALYEAIPEGVPADLKSFTELYNQAKKDGFISGKVDDIIDGRLEEGDVDFRTLYKDVLPHISGEISKEYAQQMPNRVKIEALESLANNIRIDQPTFIENNVGTVGEQAAKAATTARDYYKYTVAKYRNMKGTPISELWRVYDDTWHDHLGTIDAEKNIIDLGSNYPVTDKAQNVIESGVKDSNLGSSKQVIDFMSSPDYKGDRQGLVKVWKGEVAGAIAEQIQANGGDLSKVDMNLVYKTLKDKGVSIKEAFPEETKQIESFANHIIGGKLKLEKAQSALKLAQDDAEVVIKNAQKEGSDYLKSVEKTNKSLTSEVKGKVKEDLKFAKDYGKDLISKAKESAKSKEEEVYGTVLSKFVQKDPDVPNGVRPLRNGYAIFKDLLGKDNNENLIEDIVKKVKKSGDQKALDGLKSAYLTHIDDELRKGTNPNRANVNKMKQLLSPNTSWSQYGKIIFDDPKEQEALNNFELFVDAILTEQQRTHAANIPFNSGTPMSREAQSAFGFVTRFLFKTLNPVSQKISSTGARVIKYVEPDADYAKKLGQMLTDHKFAQQSFDLILNDLKKGMSPEMREARRAAILLTTKDQTLKGIEKATGKIDISGYTKSEKDKEKDKKVPEGVIP